MTDKQKIEQLKEALLRYVAVYGKTHLQADGLYTTAELMSKFGITALPKKVVVLTEEEYNALLLEQKRLNKVVKHFQELIEDGKLVSRIGEDEIVVKADKYKRLVSILKNLKALAHDVDDYRDDIIADYRNMAETHMDWIIEELLNLNVEELL